MRTALRTIILAIREAWNPQTALFGNGEVGVFYDVSDMSTLFQDSAGTTPVTAPEQPVGLILDKSKGLVLGPELVVNGDFSNGTTGWSSLFSATLSAVSSTLRVTNSNFSGAEQVETTVVGKTYKISASVVNVSGLTSNRVFVSTATGRGGTQLFDSGTSNVTREVVGYFTATTTTTYVSLNTFNGTAGVYADFDNISVRELPGAHAVQATASSRPTLSQRVNLLTKTEVFSDAVWVKQVGGSVSATNSITAPDGTVTADTWLQTGTPGSARIYSQLTTVANAVYTQSIYVKKIVGTWVNFVFIDSTNANGFAARFNLDTGAVGTSGVIGAGATLVSALIEPANNGFYKLSITGSIAQTTAFTCFLDVADGDSISLRLANGSVAIWGASLAPADQAALPYQWVDSSTSYDSSSVFPKFIRFDGIDDSMSTASIDFSGGDKMTVVAGVRKLSDAVGKVIELSTSDSSAGIFNITSEFQTTGKWTGSLRGTVGILYAQLFGVSAPLTSVLAYRYDIGGTLAADEVKLKLNGVEQALTRSGLAGAGNFGNFPLYIGARAGTSERFNGHLYSLIVRGAQSTDAQIVAAEKFTATKAGVVL